MTRSHMTLTRRETLGVGTGLAALVLSSPHFAAAPAVAPSKGALIMTTIATKERTIILYKDQGPP